MPETRLKNSPAGKTARQGQQTGPGARPDQKPGVGQGHAQKAASCQPGVIVGLRPMAVAGGVAVAGGGFMRVCKSAKSQKHFNCCCEIISIK